MPDATVVVRRLLERSGIDRAARPAHPATWHARPTVERRGSIAIVADAVLATVPSLGRIRSVVGGTAGLERSLPIAVAILVLVASVASVVPVSGGAPDSADAAQLAGWETANPDASPTPRLTVVGSIERLDLMAEVDEGLAPEADPFAEAAATAVAAEPDETGSVFALDATLLKPIAPGTRIVDGRSKMRIHRVRSGDTLSTIADAFKLRSIMPIVWSNGLKSTRLNIGQRLVIPETDGVVVKVEATDTLASIAREWKVKPEAIVEFNGLTDPSVQLGQILVIPGGRGEPLPPEPTVAPSRTRTATSRTAPSRTYSYSGGTFRWPVGGGYISQGYHYGHWAIDIAAPYGTPVYAAASGTVIFAGWRNNGGGYQVWISHGSGLYTTYNHMSSIASYAGQQVGRGQRVGRIGATGIATGPHLHFEVWRGGRPWDGGYRVNPLGYL